MVPKKTSWGAVAGWYDELLEDSADSYQKNVLLPNLIRIIEPKKGMSVIDIACGQGYFSRAFAEKGAKVTSCDISKELIEIAKKNSSINTEVNAKGSRDIKFFIASADNMRGLTLDPADVAVHVLSLQNIENLSGAISECARILKVGGRFIMVLNHPAFRIPKYSSWQWDEKKVIEPGSIPTNKKASDNDLEYRRIDAYMSDQSFEIDMTPSESDQKNKEFTVSFHRPLQSYFKALNKAGFAVTRLEEWISHKKSQTGPRSKEEDRLRKEIPMFICIEAKKLS